MTHPTRIYILISRRTQITLGVCDSLAAAQVMAEGLSGHELNWREVVNENGDDVALNWLSDDYKWEYSTREVDTYYHIHEVTDKVVCQSCGHIKAISVYNVPDDHWMPYED